MTDTASSTTGPQLTPMFATGAEPVVSTDTEPHPCPIFDTGPHPEPMRSDEPATSEADPAEEDSDEAVDAAVQVPLELDYDRAPEWDAGVGEAEPELARIARDLEAAADPAPQIVPAPAQPVVVPGAYQFVSRGTFAVIVAGVWLLAAAAGAGFYYWWYTALDKTLPVFGILLYLAVCMVASILVSMASDRAKLAALAIAVMSAPLASMAAAAVLHGAYFFEWIARPTIG